MDHILKHFDNWILAQLVSFLSHVFDTVQLRAWGTWEGKKEGPALVGLTGDRQHPETSLLSLGSTHPPWSIYPPPLLQGWFCYPAVHRDVGSAAVRVC